ncbi:MAG TPA: hypothetical protein P5056_00405 [Candidatus Paceibacterota bacterium]|nr:hypothetical protein [Candidatus Paceibacterota bacterium]
MEEKLDELLKLTKENNKILRGMRSSQRWASFFNYIYYALIIGSFIGAYYYLQPIVDKAMQSLQGVASGIQDVQGAAAGARNINISPDTIDQLQKTLNL